MGVTFLAPEGVYTSPAKLITKEITDNGTYSAADDNANGFSSVTVNVPSPTGKITITENGTGINIAQYATADVNVEGGGGSSDFSTANITVTNNTNNDIYIYGAIISSTEPFATGEVTRGDTAVWGLETNIFKVVVADAGAVVYFKNANESLPSISDIDGDAEQVSTGMILATGDCTITIS